MLDLSKVTHTKDLVLCNSSHYKQIAFVYKCLSKVCRNAAFYVNSTDTFCYKYSTCRERDLKYVYLHETLK